MPRCRGNNEADYLCCEENCNDDPLKCQSLRCTYCRHTNCLHNIGYELIKNKTKNITERVQLEHNTTQFWQRNVGQLQRDVKQLMEYLDMINFHEWGLEHKQVLIVNEKFSQVKPNDILIFSQKQSHGHSINSKYIKPAVLIKSIKSISKEVQTLKNRCRQIFKISEQLAATEISLKQITQNQYRNDPRFQYQLIRQLIKQHQKIKQQHRKRSQMEYPFQTQQSQIFRNLYCILFRCLIKQIDINISINGQIGDSYQMLCSCQQIIQCQLFDLRELQRIKVEYKRTSAEIKYHYAKKSNLRQRKSDLFRDVMSYYQELDQLTDQQIERMIEISFYLGANDVYLQMLLELRKRKDHQLATDYLIKIRDQYTRLNNHLQAIAYNKQILERYLEQQQLKKKEIEDLYTRIIEFYDHRNRNIMELLIIQKKELDYYMKVYPQDQYIHFEKSLQMKKNIITNSLILHSAPNQASQLAYKTSQKCHSMYIKLSQQAQDVQRAVYRHQSLKKIKNVLKYMQWFTIKFLEIKSDVTKLSEEQKQFVVDAVLSLCDKESDNKFEVLYWLSKYTYAHNLELAKEYIERTLEIYPVAQLYYNLAFILYKQHHDNSFQQAQIYLKLALGLSAEYNQAKFLLAKCHLNLNEIQSASKNFEQLLSYKEKIKEVYCYLGECYEVMLEEMNLERERNPDLMDDQQFEQNYVKLAQKTRNHYEMSLAQDDRHPMALMGKARSLTSVQRYEQARQTLTNKLGIIPESLKIQFLELLGRIYEAEAHSQYLNTGIKNYDLLQQAEKMYKQVYDLDNHRDDNLTSIKRQLQM